MVCQLECDTFLSEKKWFKNVKIHIKNIYVVRMGNNNTLCAKCKKKKKKILTDVIIYIT